MTIGLTAANAAKAYLTTKDLTTVTNFYAEIENPDSDDGNTSNNRQIPCVICFAENIEEYPPRSGNFNLSLHFRLVASKDDLTATEFDALYSEVFDAINTDTVLDDITAAATASTPVIAFRAFGFWGDVQQSNVTVENRNRVVEMVLPINCCAKTIAAS